MAITQKIAGISLVLILLSQGNILADTYKPSGSASQENVYIFGPHPYSNPQDVFEDYDPIMRYLERKLPGSHFQIETSKDYADYEAKLAAQRFHFSLPNPYQAVFSLKHNYRVIAKMTPDEDFRGLLVARTDKHIRSLHDLADKTLCFPSPTAVAATMLPLLYLREKQGVAIMHNLNISYVGSQFSSMLNAYAGDATACGTSVRFWRTWSRDNPDKAAQMQVIFKTSALPHNAIIARSDISPRLAQHVASVLAGLDKDKEVDQKQFKIDQQHFEFANDAAYKPMQDFLHRYDQLIGLPSSMKTRNPQ